MNFLQLFGSEVDCYRRNLCIDTLGKPRFRRRQEAEGVSKETFGYLVVEGHQFSPTSLPTSVSNIVLELVPWNEPSLKALFQYYRHEIHEKDVAICVGLLSLRNELYSNWETWKESGDAVASHLPLTLFSRLVLSLSSQQVSANERDTDKARSPLETFVDVVLETLPNLKWEQVARCLDFPSFYVKDTKVLENIVNTYRKATGVCITTSEFGKGNLLVKPQWDS